MECEKKFGWENRYWGSGIYFSFFDKKKKKEKKSCVITTNIALTLSDIWGSTGMYDIQVYPTYQKTSYGLYKCNICCYSTLFRYFFLIIFFILVIKNKKIPDPKYLWV